MKISEHTSDLASLWTPLPPTCDASKPPAPTANTWYIQINEENKMKFSSKQYLQLSSIFTYTFLTQNKQKKSQRFYCKFKIEQRDAE